MRTAFVHIGRHKTGSTAIQGFLEAERSALAERGLWVLRRTDYAAHSPLSGALPVPGTNLFDLANAFLRDGVLTGVRARGLVPVLPDSAKAALARAVNAVLRAAPQPDVVLSAEGFSFYRTAAETQWLDRVTEGFARRVLLFEREPESWARSYLAQTRWLQKTHPELLHTPGSVLDLSDTGWQMDAGGLARTFGLDQGLSYEAAVARDGSVVPALLRWMGVASEDFAEAAAQWRNRTQRSGGPVGPAGGS